MRGRMWSPKDAQTAIQAWYDRLMAAYNADKWKEIGELYNDDSIVFSRKSQKTFKGKTQIKGFWKDFVKGKYGRMISLKLTVNALAPTDRLIREDLAFERAVQIVQWSGTVTLQKTGQPSVPVEIPFEGLGPHMEECIFNNPDYESYVL